MLHRAENVRISHRRGFFTSNGEVVLTVGKKNYLLGKVKEQLFNQRQQAQMQYPRRVTSIKGRRYWQFENKFYWESDDLRSDEVHALLAMKEELKKKRLENAQLHSALGSGPRMATGRKAIPDDVKVYIFKRDAGSCRACGSTTEIQYDHIIPLKLGGSNNVENLQILCGPCNRSKSAGLTTRR